MTVEQDGLLQKARRNIRSAKLLLADGDFDTAVSRAYYAMFYVAEALLLSRGLAYSRHSAVIAAFGREFAKGGVMPGGAPCPLESRLRGAKYLGLPACFARDGGRDDTTYLSRRGVTRGGRRVLEGSTPLT